MDGSMEGGTGDRGHGRGNGEWGTGTGDGGRGTGLVAWNGDLAFGRVVKASHSTCQVPGLIFVEISFLVLLEGGRKGWKDVRMEGWGDEGGMEVWREVRGTGDGERGTGDKGQGTGDGLGTGIWPLGEW